MLFDIKNETLPREELRKLQLQRLQDLCRRVYANVPFYKKRFDEMGIKPTDVRSLSDLRHLPFTEKQDLRNNYPYGLFAVPRENMARVHASSGTTGQAVVVGYTPRDLENWGKLMARCMCACGVTPEDIVHVAYGYGLFTGGLGAHDGAQTLGAMVVPASGGATKRQAQLIRDLGATVLACTPSFALHLWESGMETGINFRDLPLKIGIFGGEPWSESMRHSMEEKMGIDAHNVYGLSEIMGPGVAIDCMEHNGIHLWEDHFLAEIIDPVTGENLPEGEVGELVITTLTKEGSPLIRYRTRDLTSIDSTPCRCGRTHLRLSRLAGRTDDMLIIRGVNVFPQQIENLLMETRGISPNYLIVVDRQGTLDTLEVQVEVTPQLFHDKIRDLQALESRLQDSIKEFCGVTAKIRLMEPHSIERSGGKATRVLDRRPKQ
ncbi:MAG TPA: phenylacetate--CoA ligase [Candidatus Desulfovibrio intestinipullorum]|uniref:Phenylacetate-coenzyme A ligase n=1 Tax=Candidatus Desulfovibrio intestinipullorum TaxID=2838536 RepID=A0A9D1TP33_9BACT|nr:phenylacetate--CoA ligase [Candidatus Desulfovibrio intestinipullorum]